VTTQNFQVERYTFSNLTFAGGPYYYPSAAGTILEGYDHLTVRAQLVGGAGNLVTLTVESDTGLGTWAWDETTGMYDWMTNARGAATFVGGPGATTVCRLFACHHQARLWRVKLEVVDDQAPDNSGIIEFRKVKV